MSFSIWWWQCSIIKKTDTLCSQKRDKGLTPKASIYDECFDMRNIIPKWNVFVFVSYNINILICSVLFAFHWFAYSFFFHRIQSGRVWFTIVCPWLNTFSVCWTELVCNEFWSCLSGILMKPLLEAVFDNQGWPTVIYEYTVSRKFLLQLNVTSLKLDIFFFKLKLEYCRPTFIKKSICY